MVEINLINWLNAYKKLFTGGSASSFCHNGVLDGFESTSHLRVTGIPSLSGYPKPGVLVIANDGVSGIERKIFKSYLSTKFPF